MTITENNIGVLIADSQFLITESLNMILQNDNRFYVSKVVTEKKISLQSWQGITSHC
ncbi:MAG: hypothetical protein IPJ37_22755 [Bacteroidales bacterium]|nr:hypothetical protein [Bacteroidales bacterium]